MHSWFGGGGCEFIVAKLDDFAGFDCGGVERSKDLVEVDKAVGDNILPYGIGCRWTFGGSDKGLLGEIKVSQIISFGEDRLCEIGLHPRWGVVVREREEGGVNGLTRICIVTILARPFAFLSLFL